MSSSLRVVVTGLIAQHCRLGGVAWDYLNFVLGLRRLGHDVLYLEDSGEWPYKPEYPWIASDCDENVHKLARTMAHFDLADRWAYRCPLGPRWYGLRDSRRRDLIDSADLLIDVSGTLEWPEEYRRIPRMVYIDTDPVFTQVYLAQDRERTRERTRVYDAHFSVGERIAEVGPATGQRWRPTKHPIVLDEWQTATEPRPVFTTIMAWASYKPVLHEGRSYGQKDVELRRLLELPNRTSARFEIALAPMAHVDWETHETALPDAVEQVLRRNPDFSPRRLLEHFGWRVVDAEDVGGDFRRYREFVCSSQAEWSVAKNGYVRGHCGWFSGRSACYLAAGRPVVVQDTGFGSVLPVGLGVVPFSNLEEAAEGVRRVASDYSRHALAAREIAAAYFDSDKVLRRLIAEAMEDVPTSPC